MQSHLQSEERAPGVVWMALVLRAPWDGGMTLAALGPRSRRGGQQVRIANINVSYLHARRKLRLVRCIPPSRNSQRFPVFPHLFGLYRSWLP
jgi:hypothetical protein